MQQDLKKAQENNPELFEEHFKHLKEDVENGQYFKDCLAWYMFKYVNPIVDRVVMSVASVIAFICLYFLYQIISNALPLVEEVPIVIRDHDMALYRPMIYDLYDKEDKNIENVDEAVAKYLLVNYVRARESYDFRNSEVSAVNEKFTRIKNNSSFTEYKNFQLFMSRENANSPINNFGKNIYQTTEITSVEFMRSAPKDNYEKLKWLFSNKIPNEAGIKFSTTTYFVDSNGEKKQVQENYLAKVKFNFAGLDRNAKAGVLNFVVNEYRLFKVRN